LEQRKIRNWWNLRTKETEGFVLPQLSSLESTNRRVGRSKGGCPKEVLEQSNSFSSKEKLWASKRLLVDLEQHEWGREYSSKGGRDDSPKGGGADDASNLVILTLRSGEIKKKETTEMCVKQTVIDTTLSFLLSKKNRAW